MALRFKPSVFVWLVVWVAGLVSAKPATTGELKTKIFGKTSDGTQVDLYTLANSKGMQVSIATLGGIVVGDVKKLVETCISDWWSCSRFTP